MGRTKSWLALVLAIVMVLGMAVPTAFAEDVVEPLDWDGGKIYYRAHGTTDDIAVLTGDAFALTMDDATVQYDLFADDAGEVALTEKAMGQALKYTIVNEDSAYVSVVSGDGWIKVTPVNMTYDTKAEIYMTIDNTDGDWASYNEEWEDDAFFVSEFKASVIPTFAYAGTKEAKYIKLDLNPDLELTSQKVVLSTKPAGKKIKVITASQTGTAAEAYVVSGVLYARLSDAQTAGEGTITISEVEIDGYSLELEGDDIVSIPYKVGNSVAGKPYALKAEKSDYSWKVNAEEPSFTVSIVDMNGDPVKTADLGDLSLEDVSAEFTADKDATKPVGNAGMTFGEATSKGKVAVTFAEGLISTAGTVKATLTGVLSADIPVVVEPLNLTTSWGTSTADLYFSRDTTYTNTKTTATIKLSSTDATTTDPLNTLDGGDVMVEVYDANDAEVTGLFTFTADGTNQYKIKVADPATAEAGTYTLVFSGTIGELSTATAKATIKVTDQTKVPTITWSPSGTSIELDMQSAEKNKVELKLTAGNAFNNDGTGTTIEIEEAKWASKDGGLLEELVWGAANTTLGTIAVDLKGKTMGTGTLTISGTVNGEEFTKKAYNVSIVDKTPNKPTKIVVTGATDDKISAKVGSAPALTVKVTDYTGTTQIPGSAGKVVAKFASTDSNVGDFASTSANDLSGKFNLLTTAAGKDTLTLTYTYTPEGGDETTLTKTIALEVTAPVFATKPTKAEGFVVDLKTATALKGVDVVITLTSADGTISDVTATCEDYAGKEEVEIGDYNAAKGTITLTFGNGARVHLARRQKLTVSCKVDNADTTPIVIPFDVVDSRAIVADKDSFLFENRVGGTMESTLTLSENPEGANMVITEVKSSDTSKVTVTAQAGSTTVYDVVAVGPTGEGNITVKGTINGSVVEPLVIDFSVVSDASIIELVVTPATVALDLDVNKTVTLQVAASDATSTVATPKINYTGDIVTIDNMTITAVKAGETTVEVEGYINGIKKTKNVTVKVTSGPGPITSDTIMIDGVAYIDGATFDVPNNYKAHDYKVTIRTKEGADVTAVTLKETAPKGKSKRFKIVNGNQLQPTLVSGTTKLTVTPTGGTPITVNLTVKKLAPVDTTPIDGPMANINPVVGTRGYFFDYKTTNTPQAYYTQPKFWSFKTSSKTRATVSSGGIVSFKKAGTVTITATKKSSNNGKIKKISFQFNVVDQYTGTKYWGSVLSNSATKADVVTAMSAMNYPNGAETKSYEFTSVDYKAMVAYLVANAKETDVSAIYISGGTISKSGVAFTDKTVPMLEIAKDLSTVKGKIFLALDGAASTLYSSKDIPATPADIAKVFATVEAGMESKATPLTDASSNNFWSKSKFYVLSATGKKSQTSVSATRQANFEKAYATALTLNNGLFANGENIITLKELYSAVKKDVGGTIGYYPTNVEGVAVGYLAPPTNP